MPNLPDLPGETFEIGAYRFYISNRHRFGTDGVMLARFAAQKKHDRLCDLCSGCGVVPFFLLAESPPAHITAVEIDEEAVNLLQNSIRDFAPQADFHVIHADLREKHPSLMPESFDMVTANPPYFRKDSGFLPSRRDSVARHELMCGFNDVALCAARLLKYGGYFCFCHLPSRMSEIFSALNAAKLEPKHMTLISGKSGYWLCLIRAKKGGKPGLIVDTAQPEKFAL
jgi:tRNA1(Val) A37 N6-methylase TrmN6